MGDFDRYRISNHELRERDVPDPRASWGIIQKFALSFDGYARHRSFDRCAAIGNRWAAAYGKTKELPDTLDELRTCLFFEQRRWRHFGESPDAVTRQYIAALLPKLRSAVSSSPGAGKAKRGLSRSSIRGQK